MSIDPNRIRGKEIDTGQSVVYQGLMSKTTTPFIDELKNYQLNLTNQYELNQLNRLSFIPFLENGDATVTIINNLASTTPTIGSCNNLHLSYLGLDRFTVKQKSSYFDIGEDEQPVSLSEKTNFVNFLQEMLGKEKGMKDLQLSIKKVAANFLTYGNACIELVRITKNGKKACRIRALDFAEFRYENTKDTNELGDFGFICENFATVNYDSRIPFQRYSMFPNFTAHDDGTERCILHVKNEASGRNWYGLPYSINSIYQQFTEFQQSKFASIGLNNMFQPKLALFKQLPEFDIHETSEDIQKKIDKLNEIYTNAGNISGNNTRPILAINYLHGEERPVLQEIRPTQDTNYSKFLSEDGKKKIYAVCGVNDMLLEKGGNNLGGGNALYQAAQAFYSIQITKLKNDVLEPIISALNSFFEWVGYKNPNNLVIDLNPPKFLETLESFGKVQSAQATPAAQTAKQIIGADTKTGDGLVDNLDNEAPNE